MTLTKEQQKKAEENMGLVHQVIKDKVHGYNQWGFYTYDDLFQIGCIGLCKAAATDKGGTFSTYAYRLIWHEICDALIQSTKRYIKRFLYSSSYRLCRKVRRFYAYKTGKSYLCKMKRLTVIFLWIKHLFLKYAIIS